MGKVGEEEVVIIGLNTNKVICKYNWFMESGLLRETKKRMMVISSFYVRLEAISKMIP